MGTGHAVCIGIDDYPSPNSLNGCAADAEAWSNLLTEVFGFDRANIRMLIDKSASRSSILSTIEAILSKAAKGDVVAVTASCHGSYIPGRDRNVQLVLCPYDVETQYIELTELSELTKRAAAGVKVSIILDTCFQGTISRVLYAENFPGKRTLDDRRARFLSPAIMGKKLAANPLGTTAGVSEWNGLALLSTAQNQLAYEAYIDGSYQGAFTFAAVKSIRSAGKAITPAKLIGSTLSWLEQNDFLQSPTLLSKPARGSKLLFG